MGTYSVSDMCITHINTILHFVIRELPVFFPGEFHRQGSLVGYHRWGCKESDTAERLTLSLLTLF